MTPSRTRSASLDVRGPFSLEEVALMGFGHRDERRFEGVMRLACCLDADHDADHDADLDGEAFDRLCAADPVLAGVHAVAPGFRPALFCCLSGVPAAS